MMNFSKYHALGNDYIVIHPQNSQKELAPDLIRLICDRNYGVGSDGILYGPLDSKRADVALKIYNPDGSEAEKSGNGLRIFARSLVDEGLADKPEFTVETSGGLVTCSVSANRKMVEVDMGTVSFDSTKIPVVGETREVLNETIEIDGQTLTYCAATVGNPHCVIFSDKPSAAETHRYGPRIETEERFPNRTNVQFMKVLDRTTIQIEIWERGAGYTLASGSSSTAAAAVAFKLGLCDSDITVHMPGGTLAIHLDDDFSATMIGPVCRICSGTLSDEIQTNT